MMGTINETSEILIDLASKQLACPELTGQAVERLIESSGTVSGLREVLLNELNLELGHAQNTKVLALTVIQELKKIRFPDIDSLVPVVIQAINQIESREKAIETIACFAENAVEAVPVLIEMLESEHRLVAAFALLQIEGTSNRSEALLKQLVTALESEKAYVASDLLGKLTAFENQILKLLTPLRSSPSIRRRAYAELVVFQITDNCQPFLDVLSEMTASDDIDDCNLALELLTDVGPAAADVSDSVESLLERFEDADSFEYESLELAHAHYSLIVLKQAEPMIAFAHRKLLSEDHIDRLFALCLVGEQLESEGVRNLIEIAVGDLNAEVREMAGRMLNAIGK